MSLMMLWMFCTCPEGDMFKIWLNMMSLKASRTSSKIDDISRVLAGVDDDFDVPDLGWYPS